MIIGLHDAEKEHMKRKTFPNLAADEAVRLAQIPKRSNRMVESSRLL